jgi:hypothetical protein
MVAASASVARAHDSESDGMAPETAAAADAAAPAPDAHVAPAASRHTSALCAGPRAEATPTKWRAVATRARCCAMAWGEPVPAPKPTPALAPLFERSLSDESMLMSSPPPPPLLLFRAAPPPALEALLRADAEPPPSPSPAAEASEPKE